MRDLKRMRDRFIQGTISVRLGNLASNLLRLNKWILMRHNDQAIIDLKREIAWFMEWSGDLASAELADMQREICRWRLVWPVEQHFCWGLVEIPARAGASATYGGRGQNPALLTELTSVGF
jgi:hypothetical protein